MNDLKDNKFFDSIKGKNVRIVQKDGHTKFGLCKDFDSNFVFLKFNDGSDVAVSIDNIVEIKILS